MHGSRAVKSIAAQVLGWILVVAGIAALVLPGPGLLALFAGMALLATQYSWAERRLAPVRRAALDSARHSVQSVLRILMSGLLVLGLVVTGVVWGMRPDAPGWWPVADRWWLVGGWGTGATLIGSGVIAGAMVLYSFVNYRDQRSVPSDDEPAQSSGS
ncbi:PGPGW domain-containing protein [Nocardioides gilvus]|uniref:PGPGW domain-containing protein n=1 Tax=Nocardioides gilvus TaxID=1735589 RepID=UPI00194EFF39|nr:PGPGW domain-containing protein [Nocardioides gilvus]